MGHKWPMTSQGMVERSHWGSKYLLMLKPGGWSLFSAIAIGWRWIEHYTKGWMSCESYIEAATCYCIWFVGSNVCEYACKRPMELIPICMQSHRCQGGSTGILASASLASQSDLRVAGPVSDILFQTNKQLVTIWNVNTAITLLVKWCEMWNQTLSEDLNDFLVHEAIVASQIIPVINPIASLCIRNVDEKQLHVTFCSLRMDMCNRPGCRFQLASPLQKPWCFKNWRKLPGVESVATSSDPFHHTPMQQKGYCGGWHWLWFLFLSSLILWFVGIETWKIIGC